MATSGNIAWELNRNELIEAAYRKLGIPGEGNTLTATQYTDGLQALNAVVALAVTDGMSLWKRTVVTVTPSATSQVYTLTGAVKTAQVVLKDVTSGTQWELENKSLYDFYKLPTGASGVPVNYMWQPSITGGTVSIWPLTSDSGTIANKQILIIYQKEFDGFTSTITDTLDFPSYWTQAIIYKVAVALAPENGVPIADRQDLRTEAQMYWGQATSYSDEDGSLLIQPYTQG